MKSSNLALRQEPEMEFPAPAAPADENGELRWAAARSAGTGLRKRHFLDVRTIEIRDQGLPTFRVR